MNEQVKISQPHGFEEFPALPQKVALIGWTAYFNGYKIGTVVWQRDFMIMLSNPIFPGPHGIDRFTYTSPPVWFSPQNSALTLLNCA